MAVNRIDIYTCSFCSSGGSVDEEEKRIMRRLLQYGIKPTGQKSIDKPKLHEIELQKAKLEDYVSNKFLTVTKVNKKKFRQRRKKNAKKETPKNIQILSKPKKLWANKYIWLLK